MRARLILSTLLGLTAMCAGTPLAGDLPPGPSTTTNQPPHRSRVPLVRRQEVEILPEEKRQFRLGIRTAEEARKEMDLIAWATDATTECIKMMDGQTQASNEAGIAICYNIPALFMEAQPPLFAIDMRMFKINDATGDWANIDSEGYMIDVKFSNGTAAAQRNSTAPEIAAAKAAEGEGNNIHLLESHPWIGTLSPDIVTRDPDVEEFKRILTPEVTLMASTSDGRKIQQRIKIEDTSFLLGVFSPTRAPPTPTPPAPFELPGTKIEITPIGLYIFAAYMALACGMYGWGTYERAQFREQYRKKMAQRGPVR